MSTEREKLIKYKMYLESEKIRIAKKELRRLKQELELERGNYRRRNKN